MLKATTEHKAVHSESTSIRNQKNAHRPGPENLSCAQPAQDFLPRLQRTAVEFGLLGPGFSFFGSALGSVYTLLGYALFKKAAKGTLFLFSVIGRSPSGSKVARAV